MPFSHRMEQLMRMMEEKLAGTTPPIQSSASSASINAPIACKIQPSSSSASSISSGVPDNGLCGTGRGHLHVTAILLLRRGGPPPHLLPVHVRLRLPRGRRGSAFRGDWRGAVAAVPGRPAIIGENGWNSILVIPCCSQKLVSFFFKKRRKWIC